MLHNRLVWMLISLVVGFLQAGDSGMFQAGLAVQALIVVGILLPALAIGAGVSQGARVVTLIAAALLLLWARMIAPTSLNTLHLALLVPALYVLFQRRRTPGGSSGELAKTH